MPLVHVDMRCMGMLTQLLVHMDMRHMGRRRGTMTQQAMTMQLRSSRCQATSMWRLVPRGGMMHTQSMLRMSMHGSSTRATMRATKLQAHITQMSGATTIMLSLLLVLMPAITQAQPLPPSMQGLTMHGGIMGRRVSQRQSRWERLCMTMLKSGMQGMSPRLHMSSSSSMTIRSFE